MIGVLPDDFLDNSILYLIDCTFFSSLSVVGFTSGTRSFYWGSFDKNGNLDGASDLPVWCDINQGEKYKVNSYVSHNGEWEFYISIYDAHLWEYTYLVDFTKRLYRIAHGVYSGITSPQFSGYLLFNNGDPSDLYQCFVYSQLNTNYIMCDYVPVMP